MEKFKLKTGDTVKVISGACRGQRGAIKSVDRQRRRVFVEGVNLVTKHLKATKENPGQRIKQEASIHISNVSYCDSEDVCSRVGYRFASDGCKERFAKKTNNKIDEVGKAHGQQKG